MLPGLARAHSYLLTSTHTFADIENRERPCSEAQSEQQNKVLSEAQRNVPGCRVSKYQNIFLIFRINSLIDDNECKRLLSQFLFCSLGPPHCPTAILHFRVGLVKQVDRADLS